MKKKIIVHGIITARKGSKGLKNKNIKKINGKTLVEISTKIAKSSKIFDKIFCSSDSKKILNILKDKVICIRRPRNISKDNSTSESAVLHYFNYLGKNNIKYPDILFLFQPTSPFVKISTIHKMFDVYKKNNKINSVVSVFEVPHKYNYLNQRIIKKNSEMKFIFKRKSIHYQRQNKPKVYVHGNLHSVKVSAFLKKKKFLVNPIKTVEISTFKESIDIDNKFDLELAKKFA